MMSGVLSAIRYYAECVWFVNDFKARYWLGVHPNWLFFFQKKIWVSVKETVTMNGGARSSSAVASPYNMDKLRLQTCRRVQVSMILEGERGSSSVILPRPLVFDASKDCSVCCFGGTPARVPVGVPFGWSSSIPFWRDSVRLSFWEGHGWSLFTWVIRWLSSSHDF